MVEEHIDEGFSPVDTVVLRFRDLDANTIQAFLEEYGQRLRLEHGVDVVITRMCRVTQGALEVIIRFAEMEEQEGGILE